MEKRWLNRNWVRICAGRVDEEILNELYEFIFVLMFGIIFCNLLKYVGGKDYW